MQIVRWFARSLGLLGFLFVLMFAVGEGVPVPWEQPLGVQFELAGTALMVLGLLVGWKWESSAAALIVIGWSLFLAASRRWPPWPFILFLIVAGLYACCGLEEQPREKAKTKGNSS
jgi:hypothetical protein